MDLVDRLLDRTSRTFALTIPLLPEPTRRELGVAYLLFRVADTLEDAGWPPEHRASALDAWAALLREPSAEVAHRLSASWVRGAPIDHPGYQELLAHLPQVLAAFQDLAHPARDAVARHVLRTTEGMAALLRRDPGGLVRLRDLRDLRDYCYVVAGIVGELATELFVLDHPPLRAVAPALQDRAVRFGEALQLVNILKDAAIDAGEGRFFLPPGTDRATVFALAREDLDVAAEYVRILQEADAPRGVVAFCALPIRLARAALDRVERHGPGAKVPRDRVLAIVQALHADLDRGAPAA